MVQKCRGWQYFSMKLTRVLLSFFTSTITQMPIQLSVQVQYLLMDDTKLQSQGLKIELLLTSIELVTSQEAGGGVNTGHVASGQPGRRFNFLKKKETREKERKNEWSGWLDVDKQSHGFFILNSGTICLTFSPATSAAIFSYFIL